MGAPAFLLGKSKVIPRLVLSQPTHFLKMTRRDNRLLNRIKDLFRPAKDISGERLYRHLRNLGFDAEMAAKRSRYDPGIQNPLWYVRPVYWSSIDLRGLNIDTLQIKRYNDPDESSSLCYIGYRIDYIVRGFEREKWHLGKKLKRLPSSLPATVMQEGVGVYPDKNNECIRLYVKEPLLNEEKIVVEESRRRVKYRFVKDAELPSRETIEAYNEIARQVRIILGRRENEPMPIPYFNVCRSDYGPYNSKEEVEEARSKGTLREKRCRKCKSIHLVPGFLSPDFLYICAACGSELSFDAFDPVSYKVIGSRVE